MRKKIIINVVLDFSEIRKNARSLKEIRKKFKFLQKGSFLIKKKKYDSSLICIKLPINKHALLNSY